MSQETWNTVDRYFTQLLVRPDAAIEAAAAESEKAGLPAIAVSPNLGKMLMLLAQMIGARNVLEVGTLGGYSTIWLARALPSGGKIVTLEANEKHAQIARKNFERAGVNNVIELRMGQAVDSLAQLASEKRGPFDLIFIDADKEHNTEYFQWGMKLSRPGSLIVVDNVVRDGKVVDAASSDKSVQGVRRCNEAMAAEKRVVVTALQTVGSKGYDGFAIARVVE